MAEQSDLEKQFEEAVQFVKDTPSKITVPDDRKLILYGLFKQVTEGDVKGSQPFMVQFTARSKWDAWNKVKGKDPGECMKEYIEELNKQKEEFF